MRIAQAARAGFFALGFAFAACAAQAQSPTDYVGGQKTFGSWQSLGFAPVMSVSTTTSNEAFGTAVRGPVVKICNIGAYNAYVLLSVSGSTTVTPTTGTLILPGCWSLYAAGATNIAAISVGGSTTLNIELGSGNFNYAPAPSTSNGPTSNVNVLSLPSVTGNVGGYDNDVATTPTVQASGYVASNCMGGKQTISIFRTTALPEGILNWLSITSASGNTAAMTAYIFKTNPTNSTCTDKGTFTLATADLPKLIAAVVLSPTVPQGATAAVAQQPLGLSVQNGDSGQTTNLYVMLVANASVTPGSASDLTFILSLSQD